MRVRGLIDEKVCFVFKPKGADRKQKTDREKMEKRAAHEKEKYQPSYDTTVLTEVMRRPPAPRRGRAVPPGATARMSFGCGGAGKLGWSVGIMFLVKSAGKILPLNWGSFK